MTVHAFKDSLALSKQYERARWWEPVYRKAFPSFHSMMSVRSDGWAQRGGIDRVVQLKSGKTVLIDEKVRSKSYGDILLERWSSKERKTKGWIQKDLATDYIAYAFVPDQRCYMLPFLSLRKAWILKGRAWIASAENSRNGYRIVLAKNHGYTTESVAVPIPDLLAALAEAQIVNWEAA